MGFSIGYMWVNFLLSSDFCDLRLVVESILLVAQHILRRTLEWRFECLGFNEDYYNGIDFLLWVTGMKFSWVAIHFSEEQGMRVNIFLLIFVIYQWVIPFVLMWNILLFNESSYWNGCCLFVLWNVSIQNSKNYCRLRFIDLLPE